MHANARRGEHGRSAPATDPVAEFARAWAQAQSPPNLTAFLRSDRDGMFDLVRIDLQQRWLRAGLGKRIADYCAELSGLELGDVPADLVYEEFVIRRQAGERVDPHEYLREYPAQAGELAELLALDEGTRTRWVGEQTVAPDRTVTADGTVIADGTVAADFTRTAAAGLDGTATRTSLARPPRRDALEEVAVGDQVDDFDLLTGLGAGAFARVFLARQRSMQRLVAVKISADHGSEPQTLARLDHDYIVRIFDQRVLPEQRLKLLYMQFLPGGTLLGVLRWVRATPVEQRNGQLLLDAVDAAMEEKGEIRPSDSSVRDEIAGLTWPETVAWLGRRLAEALDYANTRGVLHRDVKPANVLLTAEGVPKLADFNISYSRNTDGTSPVAYFGGSLSYMSPEQLEACHPHRPGTAADLDTRADIFSLGVVLWELLTGSKPFDDAGTGGGDDTQIDTMLHTRRGGLTDAVLDQLPADCPAALRRVLLTCLAPDPARRFETGGELAQQLDLCLDARARDLVDPPPNSWRLRLRPWIFPLVALAVGIPNGLASWYNIHHNGSLIIEKLSPDVQQKFALVAVIDNAAFFPIGGALMIYFFRRVLLVSRGLRKGRSYDEQTLAKARQDVLLGADRIAFIVLGAWLLAGVTTPILLQIIAGEGLPLSAYVHFFASLAVCGAIAASYPFFLIAFYMTRSIYPMFLQHGEASEVDARNLRGLDRRSNFYLAVAASVPLLGVAGVTFIAPEDIPSVIFAVRVVCVGGIIAFIVAYRLFRLLEEDLRALERVVRTGPAHG